MDRFIAKNRKFFFISLITILFFAFSLSLTIEASRREAQAANNSSYIVMRADTLEVIKGANYTIRQPMASTTKIMTALLICENCPPDKSVQITKESVGIEGSSVYLKEGETYTVKELLLGLMLRSGNDCATALAISLGGSVDNFVEMMNLRASQLGLKDTHYVNPHGLHHKDHYTSCYDLCKLGCIAMKNPLFKEIVGTKLSTIGKGEYQKTIANKNKILFHYDGGNGIKTGYTKAAGRCLVASAERENVKLVSAALNVPDMFGMCENLLDYGFSVLKKQVLK